MITNEQKERLESHGEKITSISNTIDQGNAALCIEWWEVGKELSDPSYHTGRKDSRYKTPIAAPDMVDICACLGLSIVKSKSGMPNGNVTVNQARKFYATFPSERDRDQVISEYKTWSNVRYNALTGKESDPSAGTLDAKGRSKRGRGRRHSQTHKGRLITPHNTRLIWDKAIEDFMASTGEDYSTSREILFRVMAELDYVPIMRDLWRRIYSNSVV